MRRQAAHGSSWVQAAIAISLIASVAVAGVRAVITDSQHEQLRRATEDLRSRIAESLLLVEEIEAGRVTRIYARAQSEQLIKALRSTDSELRKNADPHAPAMHSIAVEAMKSLETTAQDAPVKAAGMLRRAESELAENARGLLPGDRR